MRSYFNRVFNYEEEICSNKSTIIALFKKGDRSVAENYRGISVSNSDCKMFDRALYNRLNKWVKDKNLLTEFKSGFNESYSTCDNIFII